MKNNKEKIMLSYTTDYYDGIISGYCWYKGKYCYFDNTKDYRYKYRLLDHEIEECKEYFKKSNLEFTEDQEWEYIDYREYTIYPFMSESDEIKALAQRAIWEDFVGFQNSLNGNAYGPRFLKNGEIKSNTAKYDFPNGNDYCFREGIETVEVDLKTYFGKIPYRNNNPQIDMSKPLTTFIMLDDREEMKAKGYLLIENTDD